MLACRVFSLGLILSSEFGFHIPAAAASDFDDTGASSAQGSANLSGTAAATDAQSVGSPDSATADDQVSASPPSAKASGSVGASSSTAPAGQTQRRTPTSAQKRASPRQGAFSGPSAGSTGLNRGRARDITVATDCLPSPSNAAPGSAGTHSTPQSLVPATPPRQIFKCKDCADFSPVLCPPRNIRSEKRHNSNSPASASADAGEISSSAPNGPNAIGRLASKSQVRQGKLNSFAAQPCTTFERLTLLADSAALALCSAQVRYWTDVPQAERDPSLVHKEFGRILRGYLQGAGADFLEARDPCHADEQELNNFLKKRDLSKKLDRSRRRSKLRTQENDYDGDSDVELSISRSSPYIQRDMRQIERVLGCHLWGRDDKGLVCESFRV